MLSRVIDEEALEQALAAAVTCTILAAAGPQRSRVLATLYKVNILQLHIVYNMNIEVKCTFLVNLKLIYIYLFYQDERCSKLKIYPILQKVLVQAFMFNLTETNAPHFRCITSCH